MLINHMERPKSTLNYYLKEVSVHHNSNILFLCALDMMLSKNKNPQGASHTAALRDLVLHYDEQWCLIYGSTKTVLLLYSRTVFSLKQKRVLNICFYLSNVCWKLVLLKNTDLFPIIKLVHIFFKPEKD